MQSPMCVLFIYYMYTVDILKKVCSGIVFIMFLGTCIFLCVLCMYLHVLYIHYLHLPCFWQHLTVGHLRLVHLVMLLVTFINFHSAPKINNSLNKIKLDICISLTDHLKWTTEGDNLWEPDMCLWGILKIFLLDTRFFPVSLERLLKLTEPSIHPSSSAASTALRVMRVEVWRWGTRKDASSSQGRHP